MMVVVLLLLPLVVHCSQALVLQSDKKGLSFSLPSLASTFIMCLQGERTSLLRQLLLLLLLMLQQQQ